MIFNSFEFAVFLPVVFVLYWFVLNRNLKLQNIFIVAASYFFYGWWDWRFLFLIFTSSLVDYSVGLLLGKHAQSEKSRRILLIFSIATNIGILGFFKYFNFFVKSFSDAFSFLGFSFNTSSLNIILPVGISFYTFQTLSYTIDVYKRKIKPTSDIFAFFAFVSFFPQLVAGPIERAKNLLPQFTKIRKFAYTEASDGMRQILWGLFKKVVIADNLASHVNYIFSNTEQLTGGILLVGSICFAYQIYCDFSGYSDIAIGTARLFGFHLMRNFAYPYFARDIAEFWRRWHISLSTWFRDYVYIPLGGNSGKVSTKIKNVFIIFIVSGLWHGANWTYVVWGLLNALYFMPLMLLGMNRKHIEIVAKNKFFPSLKEFFGISTTFAFTLLAWIFFRAETVGQAFVYLKKLFTTLFNWASVTDLLSYAKSQDRSIIFLVLFFILIEWFQRLKKHGLEMQAAPLILRWIVYYTVSFAIIFFGKFERIEFIYFQF